MQKPYAYYYLLISIILLFSCSKKQDNNDENATQFAKINKLVLQADSLFILENNEAADSLLQDALQMAEATRNQDIILQTLFYNTALNITVNSTIERLDKYKAFINQGLDYAKLFKRQDYIAYANANLAELYIAKGDLPNALTAGNLAFSIALSLKNDSCKVVTALQLGKVYEKQKELLLAFKTYSNAQDIANDCGNEKLLTDVYHSIGKLYETLDKNEEAKDYYFKSLDINKKNKNLAGEIKDFIALGSVYEYKAAKDYLEQAIVLADKTKNLSLKKKAILYLFSYKVVNGNIDDALRFYNKEPLIGKVYNNRGPKYLNWIIGEVYLYGNNFDSTLYFFQKCVGEFKDDYDKNAKINMFTEYADALIKTNQTDKGIEILNEAINLSLETKNSSNIIYCSNQLKKLYTEKQDFKNALYFSNLEIEHKQILTDLTKDREFAVLEIENENKRIKIEENEKEAQTHKLHNLEYMAITIVICLFFLFLIFITRKNSFSTRAIEIIGFFAFIFLFEFIILILDNKIHHLTHGSPLWIWLIKIVIISFLLPFHHYIEEEVIHYLVSRKLIKEKNRFSLRFIWNWIPWLKKESPTKHHDKKVDEKKIEE